MKMAMTTASLHGKPEKIFEGIPTPWAYLQMYLYTFNMPSCNMYLTLS